MNASSRNAAWQDRKELATARGVAVATQIFAARAQNAHIWDIEGRRYIDFAGGIGVLNTGHRHPRVMAAVQAQLERFTHTCYQVVPYPGYIELAEKLNALAPGDFAKKPHSFPPAPRQSRTRSRSPAPRPAAAASLHFPELSTDAR